ncbi:MAG: hypothetical protein EOS78_32410 [Mesorhizobium sp.]|uniref:hypothetical protein n=1 Tax=unclassified Mesorhizobium TaxID=325217 RepID=UPI000FC9C93F|nr:MULTISPECIES: hypothetical protein [unclassified Mesorhizobium]RVD48505.1 hypothetical protein EN750_35850 [Mesorhizobium sp. M7A.F.Ca.ET.027.03.2.1]RWE28248.1 MAG: hypothetical protein EOS78_32410 [Mesorhizobium sp.]TGP87907.1 hypothetical protein EN861_28210 [Mesorhizobium sp. M8A.F.Ca.ET.218.01.1.1]TGT15705.1 hypothetical protein EN856_28025 [Mesorhizobium sp. M8A.F.Ca.ET.213.01.1.1]
MVVDKLFLTALFGCPPQGDPADLDSFGCRDVGRLDHIPGNSGAGHVQAALGPSVYRRLVWLFAVRRRCSCCCSSGMGCRKSRAVFQSNWFTSFIAALLALTLIQNANLAEILRSS